MVVESAHAKSDIVWNSPGAIEYEIEVMDDSGDFMPTRETVYVLNDKVTADSFKVIRRYLTGTLPTEK